MKGGTTMEIKKNHQEFSVCQVEDYSFVNLDSRLLFQEEE